MTATATFTTAHSIPAEDVLVGQIIRNREGEATTVVTRVVHLDNGEIIVDLANYRRVAQGETSDQALVGVATFQWGMGHVLTTWLTDRQADQPGLDSETLRCSTCDSRRCIWGRCNRPWVADAYAGTIR